MLLVHATVPLTYPKDHVLSIRSICVKYIVVMSFFKTFYCVPL